MNGPLSSIHETGFAACAFHSFPNTLRWDGYSGDYGPNFSGLRLGSATYLVMDPDLGMLAYGGILKQSGRLYTVETRDAIRRKVFIGPLGLQIEVDAGIIERFSYSPCKRSVSLTLAQLDGIPKAPSAIMWLQATSGRTNYTVTTEGITQARLGWKVPLMSSHIKVEVGQQIPQAEVYETGFAKGSDWAAKQKACSVSTSVGAKRQRRELLTAMTLYVDDTSASLVIASPI